MNENNYIQEIMNAGKKTVSANECLNRYHAVIGVQKGTETDSDIRGKIEECETIAFNMLDQGDNPILRPSNIESLRLASYVALLEQAKKVLKNKRKPATNEAAIADAAYFIALRDLARWLEAMPSQAKPDQVSELLGEKTRNSSTDLFLEE